MACYYPQIAYRSRSGRNRKTGKWPIVFNIKDGYADKTVTINCSKCIGCRLARSRAWATRIMHETTLHNQNSFLTLTYNQKSLPSDHNINIIHLQKFWKRLRKQYPETKLRYYACGEYGDKLQRPHYHAILFGKDFTEDRHIHETTQDYTIYRSPSLERIWNNGTVIIGDVTFDSAAYTARYIMKKQLGLPEGLKDCVIDFKTGELLYERTPEFNTMSQGIGKEYYKKYYKDITARDNIYTQNGIVSVPRYYDKLHEERDPKGLRKTKARRKSRIKKMEKDNTYERLLTRETIQLIKLKMLARKL